MPHYCERNGPELLAEPFNAFTNLAFIIAALLIWRYYRQQRLLTIYNSWDVGLLILCLFAIGLGSGLWHTLASRLANLADVIPIALFINIFLLSVLYRIAACRMRQIILLFVVYQLLNIAVILLLPKEFINGSGNYLPAYLALLVTTAYTLKKHLPAAAMFSTAAVIFPVSLVFRSIDLSVCDAFPTGTHFLWHTLNAVMLYCLLHGLISTAAATRIQPAENR